MQYDKEYVLGERAQRGIAFVVCVCLLCGFVRFKSGQQPVPSFNEIKIIKPGTLH